MSVVERLVQEAREKQRRAERKEAARKAVLDLSPEDRRELVADLVLLVEEEERRPRQSAAPPTNGGPTNGANGHALVTPFEKPQSFTDKAEAFVLAHPEGVKTKAVADGIGQDVSSVDGSLRSAMKRGRITRVGRLWMPVPSVKKANGAAAQPALPAKTTIRDLINRVFAANGNTPIGAAALYEALRALKPDINRSSVDGEMNRMRKDNLLVQVGVGPNSGGLYKLTEANARPN